MVSFMIFFLLQVQLSPGMRNDQKLPFRGEADQVVRESCVCVYVGVIMVHTLYASPAA